MPFDFNSQVLYPGARFGATTRGRPYSSLARAIGCADTPRARVRLWHTRVFQVLAYAPASHTARYALWAPTIALRYAGAPFFLYKLWTIRENLCRRYLWRTKGGDEQVIAKCEGILCKCLVAEYDSPVLVKEQEQCCCRACIPVIIGMYDPKRRSEIYR